MKRLVVVLLILISTLTFSTNFNEYLNSLDWVTNYGDSYPTCFIDEDMVEHIDVNQDPDGADVITIPYVTCDIGDGHKLYDIDIYTNTKAMTKKLFSQLTGGITGILIKYEAKLKMYDSGLVFNVNKIEGLCYPGYKYTCTEINKLK